jgi:hypothetical protein
MGIKGIILKGVYYTTLNGFGIHVRIHFSRKSLGKITSPLDYSVVALVALYIHLHLCHWKFNRNSTKSKLNFLQFTLEPTTLAMAGSFKTYLHFNYLIYFMNDNWSSLP